MKLFLIGFMGCGKSTLGKKLASRLQCPFIDVDKEIERSTGLNISAYFERFGEVEFRKAEHSIFETSKWPQNAVIATGGGAPCYFNTMELINAMGLSIYLKMSASVLASRLRQGSADSPLIRDYQGAELSEYTHMKLSERELYYNKAHMTVQAEGLSASDLEEAIQGYLTEINRIFY